MSDTLVPTELTTSSRVGARESVLAIDPDRWPDVASRPRGGLTAQVARGIFGYAARRLPVVVRSAVGRTAGRGTQTDPMIELHDPGAFYARLGAGGLIGFGESYMAGDWSSPDLAAALTVFAGRMATLVPPPLQRLRDLHARRQPASEQGTVEQTRTNIARHYDLSNDLFESFLDETMSYSAALFPLDADGQPIATWSTLRPAQQAKVDRILDHAGVGEGTRLLEIGTGWGELALRAASRGAHVRSITLSEEQRQAAILRAQQHGFADRIQIDLCDYRQVEGRYDAVVSVEMVEAVGFAYWDAYVDTLDRVLVPGGRIVLQAITMPDDRMLASRDTYTWIQKYVFPGGLIPSLEALDRLVDARPGLAVTDRFAMGAHYAETLRLWAERFEEAWPTVRDLGFDETFHRMWRLYLAYSEAGFRSGYLDVYQLVIVKDGQ